MRIAKNLSFKRDDGIDLAGAENDVVAWLEREAKRLNLGPQVWLLAHAVDGIVWGRLDGTGSLQTSTGISTTNRSSSSPELMSLTLLEARLFGANAQLHLWRNEDDMASNPFFACCIRDEAGGAVDDAHGDAFDEYHHLWGTDAEGWQDGFTLLTDGQVGLRHTVPIDVPASAFDPKRASYRPVKLCVRHYLDFYEETGEAFIAGSRLVSIGV